MTNSHDLVAVSGATGFIGSAVVRELLARGRHVRALIEPGAALTNLEGLPEDRVEKIFVDVCDRPRLVRALEGAAAYYHLAAIYKIWAADPAPIWRVNLEGTTTALLAAQTAGVKRIVYTSSIAAVGLRGDKVPADETNAWNIADIANDYIASKYHSERVAMCMAEAGLPIVVVNPAFPFGPRDIAPTPTGGLILNFLRGKVPAVSDGGFCAIDVDDVAKAHVAAETRGRIGERYILGNHNVTMREFFDLVADVAGLPRAKVSVPGFVTRSVSRGMEWWSDMTKTEPMATVKSVEYTQRFAFFDGSKARKELEMPCTPLRESVERAVEYFRTNGMV